MEGREGVKGAVVHALEYVARQRVGREAEHEVAHLRRTSDCGCGVRAMTVVVTVVVMVVVMTAVVMPVV